jgi:Ca2+-transporting ATPase
MAKNGLRVLGVARARFAAPTLPDKQHDFDFEFLGLVALQDPVRPEVPAAIAQCRAAGIRVVMVTGDHSATALSIAEQAGLNTNGKTLSGAEFAALSDEALAARLADTNVFCRVQPDQKLRLVQAFKARGDVVAMTGDGVNDAPALKAASIGVAMGARGTDVARQAADLVLLNDDFASLVTAVQYGRRIFANLRKAIVFVVAAHIPIVGLSLLPVVMGWPLLLMPVHILFLQLIIDPSCTVVFEGEPAETDAMQRPPRQMDARLFGSAVLARGVVQGLGLLVILVGVFVFSRNASQSDDTARALTFAVMVLANLGLIVVNRHWGSTFVRGQVGTNHAFLWVAIATLVLLTCVLFIPVLASLFAFQLPPAGMLMAGLGAVLLCLGWFDGVKRFVRTTAL